MTVPNLKLKYFKGGGRAAPIRVALRMHDIPYQDVFVTAPDYRQQPDIPLGTVPVLEISRDGKTETLLQSNAILCYVARLAGNLLPEEPLEQARALEYLGVVEDFYGYVVPSFRATDDDERKRMRESFAANELPRWLRFMASRLARSTSGYLVGDSLSVADLKVYSIWDWLGRDVLDYVPGSALLAEFPSIVAHKALLEQSARFTTALEALRAEGLA